MPPCICKQRLDRVDPKGKKGVKKGDAAAQHLQTDTKQGWMLKGCKYGRDKPLPR